ncbi:MAG: recombinase family protein [Solirubrobacteraceae bacterium]
MTTVTERRARRSSTSPTGSRTGGCAADETSPTPRETADRPLRAVAYIRESTEEQGQGFSPDAQRQGIARFAPENELELVGEYCDFHSGWRKSEARPQFQRLMADAADGRFDVVLVFHTSRFARNQVEARRYKQLLREHLGIRVISVTQPMGEDHTDRRRSCRSRSTRCSTSTTRSPVLLDEERAEGAGEARTPARHAPVGLRPRRGDEDRGPRSEACAARRRDVSALRDRS